MFRGVVQEFDDEICQKVDVSKSNGRGPEWAGPRNHVIDLEAHGSIFRVFFGIKSLPTRGSIRNHVDVSSCAMGSFQKYTDPSINGGHEHIVDERRQ